MAAVFRNRSVPHDSGDIDYWLVSGLSAVYFDWQVASGQLYTQESLTKSLQNAESDWQ